MDHEDDDLLQHPSFLQFQITANKQSVDKIEKEFKERFVELEKRSRKHDWYIAIAVGVVLTIEAFKDWLHR